jgi:hypothetical protein
VRRKIAKSNAQPPQVAGGCNVSDKLKLPDGTIVEPNVIIEGKHWWSKKTVLLVTRKDKIAGHTVIFAKSLDTYLPDNTRCQYKDADEMLTIPQLKDFRQHKVKYYNFKRLVHAITRVGEDVNSAKIIFEEKK